MKANNHLPLKAVLVCALLVCLHTANPASIAKSFAFDAKNDTDVFIQVGTTSVDVSLFDRDHMEVLHLPCTVKQIAYYGFEESSLREIIVDEGNSEYASINGLLFSKDKSILLFCPPGYEYEKLVLPDSTRIVESGCFENTRNIRTLILPDSLENIGDFAFENSSISRLYIYGRGTNFSIQAFNCCPCLQEIWVYKESEAEKILIEDVDYIDLRTKVKYIAE